MADDALFAQQYVGFREFSAHRDEIKGEIASVKIAQAEQRSEIAHVGLAVKTVDHKLDAITSGLQLMAQKIERQPAPQPQTSELVQVAREFAPMLKKSGGASVPWWVWVIIGVTVTWAFAHYLGVKP